VVEVPQSKNAELIVARVEAYPDSDMIHVTYMTRDGLTDGVSTNVYRLQHNRFVMQRHSAWPNHIRVKGEEGGRCMTFIDEGPVFADFNQLKASLSRGGRAKTVLHPEDGTRQACLSAAKAAAEEVGQKVKISSGG
jgi:hypothetical protein